ncbi:hypothetical protein [Georgenia faecalis]|uniref:hypothetical protein n=1 Tax=Georgenia faecalis TaxID=2483799 RepID=UPI000FD975BC|nr:hypothetical protein [Georgenia faecalis]
MNAYLLLVAIYFVVGTSIAGWVAIRFIDLHPSMSWRDWWILTLAYWLVSLFWPRFLWRLT